MKIFCLLSIAFLLLTNLVQGQVDFNNYLPLRSKGDMPDDFKLAAKAKIEQDEMDLSSLEKKERAQFLEQIHYGIDQLLNSGSVTYGNDVCKYIEAVADKLLKNDPTLRSKLRFYVMKSNVANAFATNQGMIFFSTGLIAQFANEAQLAYVLSHEIIHFKHNHVIESFKFESNNKRSIQQLSQYSKEHEFEADREAVQMCHDAGYSKDEVYGTLDVLMFSHLPFDELKFDNKYYNTEMFFVPDGLFTKKEYAIDFDANHNDSLSTHPNIERRRTEVDKTIGKYSNWGTEKYLLGEARFNEIRNICRFETVRNRIIRGEIPYALYEIYVLEKEFPNSESLQAFKAHAWYDLARVRVNSSWKSIFPKEKELEGASGQFFNFLMNLKAEQTYTFALRHAYDIHKMFPENEYVTTIFNRAVNLVAANGRIKVAKFYDITYQQALDKVEENRLAQLNKASDTVKVAEVAPESTDGSKYSRIRKSSTKTADGAVVTSVDSINYHLYGLSDVLQDAEFKVIFKESTEAPEVSASNKKSKKGKKSDLTGNFKVTGTIAKGEKLILTKPLIYTNVSSNNGKRNVEVKPLVVDAIDYALSKSSVNFVKIGGHSGEELFTTEEFNNNTFVQDLLIQISDLSSDSEPIVPINYEQSQRLMSKLGSKKIAYFFYGENPKYAISYGKIFGFIWNPALLFKNILEETTARYRSVAAVYTFDLESGKHETTAAIKITSKASKNVLRSSMVNLMTAK